MFAVLFAVGKDTSQIVSNIDFMGGASLPAGNSHRDVGMGRVLHGDVFFFFLRRLHCSHTDSVCLDCLGCYMLFWIPGCGCDQGSSCAGCDG